MGRQTWHDLHRKICYSTKKYIHLAVKLCFVSVIQSFADFVDTFVYLDMCDQVVRKSNSSFKVEAEYIIDINMII